MQNLKQMKLAWSLWEPRPVRSGYTSNLLGDVVNLSPSLSSSNTRLMASRQLYGHFALRALRQHNYARPDLMYKVGVSLVDPADLWLSAGVKLRLSRSQHTRHREEKKIPFWCEVSIVLNWCWWCCWCHQTTDSYIYHLLFIVVLEMTWGIFINK